MKRWGLEMKRYLGGYVFIHGSSLSLVYSEDGGGGGGGGEWSVNGDGHGDGDMDGRG